LQERLQGVRLQIAALLERGQQSGHFATDITPLALAHLLEAVLGGAIEAVADDEIDAEAGGRAATIATLRTAGVPRARAAAVLKQPASRQARGGEREVRH
jgi:hypothetical protein